MFDPCIVPTVVRTVKLRDPKAFVVFHNSLRTGAAHRCADEHQILDLRGLLSLDVLLPHEGFGNFVKLREFDRLVELAARSGRLLPKSKSERPGAVVRGIEQIVQLAKLW